MAKKKKLSKAAAAVKQRANIEPFKWKKGQSGNPKGRPLNPIPRALKELTIESYRNVIECVCAGNIDNLQAMISDPKVSVLQVGIAQAVLNALRAGDYAVIERIAERIVGKIPEELNLNSKNQNLNLNVNKVIDETKMRAAFLKMRDDV